MGCQRVHEKLDISVDATYAAILQVLVKLQTHNVETADLKLVYQSKHFSCYLTSSGDFTVLYTFFSCKHHYKVS